MSANFVYSCPLCRPAFEALRLYASRNSFYGQKVTRYDTFGAGLDSETKAALHGTPNKKRNAIQALISRWIAERSDLLRLDKGERAALKAAMKEMRDEGEKALRKV